MNPRDDRCDERIIVIREMERAVGKAATDAEACHQLVVVMPAERDAVSRSAYLRGNRPTQGDDALTVTPLHDGMVAA